MRTDRNRKRVSPQVEGLESMTLLSGVAAAVHHGHAVVQTATTQTQNLSLSGTVHGQYFAQSSNPDTGSTYSITAFGRISPLGRTAVTGSYQTPGFILNGTAHGSLTLTAAHGSLTLKLDQAGPIPQNSSGGSRLFQFTITGGTGAYAGAQGSGTVNVTLDSSNSLNLGGHHLSTGRVTLTFQPGAAPL